MSIRRPPYWLTLLLALDRWGAAVFFNRADLTISTLCWMALNVQVWMERAQVWTEATGIALGMLRDVHPYRWQYWLLVGIGHCLEFIKPGHCAKARLDELDVLDATRALLTGKGT